MRHVRAEFPKNPQQFQLIKHLESILLFSEREELRTLKKEMESVTVIGDWLLWPLCVQNYAERP